MINHHLGGVISQSSSATEQSFAKPSRLLSLRGAYKDAFRDPGDCPVRVAVTAGAADVKYDASTHLGKPVTSGRTATGR